MALPLMLAESTMKFILQYIQRVGSSYPIWVSGTSTPVDESSVAVSEYGLKLEEILLAVAYIALRSNPTSDGRTGAGRGAG